MKKMVDGIVMDMTAEDIASIQAIQESPEYKMQQISILKSQLSATDYKAIKYAEGWLSEEDYAPIKAERQAIRDKINALEAEL